MLGQCFCIHPGLHTLASTLCMLPIFCLSFFIHTGLQAFFCLTSCSLGWTTIELGGCDLWLSISFLGPLFLPGPYSVELFWADFWKSQYLFSCTMLIRLSFAFHSLPCPQDPELHHLMVLAAKVAFDLPISKKPFLGGEMRSSRASLLIFFSVTWRWKLSPMHCRNHLDGLWW